MFIFVSKLCKIFYFFFFLSIYVDFFILTFMSVNLGYTWLNGVVMWYLTLTRLIYFLKIINMWRTMIGSHGLNSSNETNLPSHPHNPNPNLRPCLVHPLKHMFSVFKQHYMYFHTFFHSHVFSHIFSNTCF